MPLEREHRQRGEEGHADGRLQGLFVRFGWTIGQHVWHARQQPEHLREV